MKHLLVTNDFPPKIGGIQSYLWELWRRLNPGDVTVLTTPYKGAAEWDGNQEFRVVRSKYFWLLPLPAMVRHINELAREVGAELVVLDPVFPLGVLGPKLDLPYVAIAHGAEYAIPARLPLTKSLVSRVTQHAAGVIACGQYVADIVRTVSADVALVDIPPGVDVNRFVTTIDRDSARARFDIPKAGDVVVGVSRLVRRKGFDRLIEAAAISGKPVWIAGKGRDQKRLESLIGKYRAPVTLLGRVADDDLPALYRAADVFCMPCHDRWFGLEQEGFGIVFVEAGAAGVPSVAGQSGGAGEAVQHGNTGLVVSAPVTANKVAEALVEVLGDPERRDRMAADARRRAETRFSYDHLAKELADFLQSARQPSDT